MDAIAGSLLLYLLLDFWVDRRQDCSSIDSAVRFAGNADFFFTHRGGFGDVLLFQAKEIRDRNKGARERR